MPLFFLAHDSWTIAKRLREEPDEANPGSQTKLIKWTDINQRNMQVESQLVPYAPRQVRQYRVPGDGEPITYGSLRKTLPNPGYNKYLAQAVGRGSRYKKRRYSRPYRRYATRGGYRGRRFRGYGAYTMDGNDPLLTQWGGWAGSKLGEAAGGAANSLVKSFTGFGDYKIKANALMPGAAIENPNTHGGTVFRGSEYIKDIFSSDVSGAFKLESFDINAALERTFPKLAQTLANYDQYVLEGLFFHFRSMCGESQSTSAIQLGSIIMSCDYNVLSPNFTSKQAMEEYEGGVSFKPSESCKYFVECDRAQSPMDVLFTRSGSVPAGGDQRMYDAGNFQIASQGITAPSQNLGELWVSYQIAGLKPKLYSGLGNYNSALLISSEDFSNTAPLLQGARTTQYTSPELTIGQIGETVLGWGITPTTLQFPQSPLDQTYSVILSWIGNAVGVLKNPTYGYSNLVPYFVDTYSPPDGQSASTMINALHVTVAANKIGQLIITNAGTTLALPTGSPKTMAIEVAQVPNLSVPV